MDANCCAIFLNGSYDLDDTQVNNLHNYHYTICVDGGGNYLKGTGILPDLLIGDFDSLEKENYEYFLSNDVSAEQYPAEKDFTDSEMAIHKAVEEGYKIVHIYGGFGSRIDHTLGNIGLILYGYELGVDVRIIDNNNNLSMLKEGQTVVPYEENKVFSIIPLYMDLASVSITGAKYNISNEKLKQGTPKGISNEFVAGNVTINNDSGLGLLCISNKI